ncbi:MAG: HAD hydrolase family protein [Veillonellaceae bacterium]|nr:HAD hydrolase family protein [Veillonellaceae bacterium]
MSNDDYMLKMADVGIASGNAIPQIKQAADRVGVTCDEGLTAYVIDLIDKGEI